MKIFDNFVKSYFKFIKLILSIILHKHHKIFWNHKRQNDHRDTTDDIHKNGGNRVADAVFQYTEQAKNQAQNTGKQQAGQRKHQRLSHGTQQQIAIDGENADHAQDSFLIM